MEKQTVHLPKYASLITMVAQSPWPLTFSTAGSSGRYRIQTPRYDRAPSVGQLSSGLQRR